MTPSITIDVCVCTFRREGVVQTLESVANQELSRPVRLRVIVADNDETPGSRAIVEGTAVRLGLDLTYLHCPARNISIARNGALDAAAADWVGFLDDDETADPCWISAMLSCAGETGADVVLGPVLAMYRDGAPVWMRAGDFHSTRPVIREGRITTGYAGNVLIRRKSSAIDGERFSLALGQSGGEDTEFFDRLCRRGARIAYAPGAVVREDVPPERARFRWLAVRRFRSGQTHGALLARNSPQLLHRTFHSATAAAKAGFSCAAALAFAARPERRASWALRAALHAGAASRLLGVAELTQYGRPSGEVTRAGGHSSGAATAEKSPRAVDPPSEE